MLRYIIGVLLCVAATSATEYRNCTNGMNGATSVSVTNCDVLPCNFIPGTDIVCNVTFTAPFLADNLKPRAMVTIFGLTVEYPGLNPDGCTDLVQGVCPVYANDIVTYGLVMYLDPTWPSAPFMQIEFSLLDNFGNGDGLVCIEVDGTYIHPSESN